MEQLEDASILEPAIKCLNKLMKKFNRLKNDIITSKEDMGYLLTMNKILHDKEKSREGGT